MTDLLSEHEKSRLLSLYSYQILDTVAEESYDRITELAASICGTEISLISFVDEHRQWFKSKKGIDVSETPKTLSFCAHAIQSSEPFIVENAAESSLFSQNPLVTGDPGIAFYAGIPLIGSDSFALGTLCVIDKKPHTLSDNQIDSLKTLAQSVVHLLELRRKNQDLIAQQLVLHQALEFNSPFFIVLAEDATILNVGKKWFKILPEMKTGESFYHYFEFSAPFSFENWISTNRKESQRVHFFEDRSKIQRYKFSILYMNHQNILSCSPVINSKFSIKNYHLTLNDFVPHDYISEYLFLQQTTDRSLKDAKAINDKIIEKNKRLSLLESFLNKVTDGIMVFNSIGKLIYHNESSKNRMLDAGSVNEVIDISSIDPRLRDPLIFDEFVFMLKTDGVYNAERKITDDYGKVTYVDINLKYESIFDSGYFISICRDVTLLKESKEEELRQVLKVTQLQNDRLKNFAHIVSHNLKSHSGNIQSLIHLILEENPNLLADDFFSMMKMASDNLTETIDHLSEIAAITVKENNSFEEIHLTDALMRAIHNISALAYNSKVEIINECEDHLFIQGIKAYIDSILLNFLTNGIKYADHSKESYLRIFSKKDEKFVELSFQDNGLGLDLKRNGEKLFGMYKTFHLNPEARGIGLFITKNQVESMGGSIHVDSKLGQGSTFTVRFERSSQ